MSSLPNILRALISNRKIMAGHVGSCGRLLACMQGLGGGL